MILAIDVDYRNNVASIGGVAVEHWDDAKESGTYKSHIGDIEPYVPGQFYRRELPCILKLLEEHELHPSHIIVDGFVYLDGRSGPGLGKYLYDALKGRVAVIGVAKTPFKGILDECKVYRGSSKKPLYVTAAGMPLDEAKNHIKSMYGRFRLPYLLKKVDQICSGENK
jgi:deoxyribonuclease V